MRPISSDRPQNPIPQYTTELDSWILDLGEFPSRTMEVTEDITRLDEWMLDVSAFPVRIPRLP